MNSSIGVVMDHYTANVHVIARRKERSLHVAENKRVSFTLLQVFVVVVFRILR